MAYAPRRAVIRFAVMLGAAVVLLAAVLVTSGRATPQTVAVTIRHSQFAPAHFTVSRGATVRFTITNSDPIDHEFILGDEAVQRRHEVGTEPSHGRVPGEVSVPAGAVGETNYTFSRAGVVLIGCHAPGHYAYGMRGWVLVAY